VYFTGNARPPGLVLLLESHQGGLHPGDSLSFYTFEPAESRKMAPPPPAKTFFVLRSLIYKPDDYIQLGQVIADPRKPYDRLAKPLPLPESLQIRKATSSNWSLTLSEVGKTDMGVFTDIVNILAAHISGSKSEAETLTRGAASLETQYFEITEDPSYVASTAKVQAVADEFKKLHNLNKTLYMVTGIKIARWSEQATQNTANATALAAKTEVVLDPDGLARAGVEVNKQESCGMDVTETPDSSYVVAYRLRRLRPTWRQRSLKVGNELNGAEMYGSGWRTTGEGGGEMEDDLENWELESVLADDMDFGPSLPAKYKLEAIDEDDKSRCFVIAIA
jgi:hypothetical protein